MKQGVVSLSHDPVDIKLIDSFLLSMSLELLVYDGIAEYSDFDRGEEDQLIRIKRSADPKNDGLDCESMVSVCFLNIFDTYYQERVKILSKYYLFKTCDTFD